MPAVAIADFDAVYGVAEAILCNKALARVGAERIEDTTENTKQANACREAYAQTRDELLRLYPASFALRDDIVLEDKAFPLSYGRFGYAFKAADYRTIDFAAGAAGAYILTATTPADITQSLVRRAITGTGIPAGARIVAVNETLGTVTLDRATTAGVANVETHIEAVKVLEVLHDPDELFETVGGGRDRRILTNRFTNSMLIGGVETAYLEVRFIDSIVNPYDFDPMFYDALVLRIASKVALPLARSQSIVGQVQSEFSSIMKEAKRLASEERSVDEGEPFWTERRIGSGPSTRRS